MIDHRSLTVRGTEVRTGVPMRHFTNHDKLAFDFYVVCDSLAPERWHGEVKFAGRLLLRTEQADNHLVAGRLAEAAFVERIVKIFGD